MPTIVPYKGTPLMNDLVPSIGSRIHVNPDEPVVVPNSSPSTPSCANAAAMFLRGATVGTATRIAVVVGTWLSLVNHGHAILDGRPPWAKVALNYLTPFVVASLGFLAARRRRNVERLVALLERDDPLDG